MKTGGYSIREQFQGFPFGQFFILSWALITQEIANNSTECYIWHIIKSFHTAKLHDEVLVYIGYLSTATYLPQILTYIFWSKQSDRIGRKATILIGLIGLAIAMLLYGFGRKFWIILLSKLVLSSLNANSAILRTALGEITHYNESHKVAAFALVPISTGLGLYFGPLIGNNLITPYTGPPPEGYVPDFAHKYPFAKPNILISILLFSAAVLVFFFMEETNLNQNFTSRNDIGLMIGNKLKSKLGLKTESPVDTASTKYQDLAHNERLVGQDPNAYEINDESGVSFEAVQEELTFLGKLKNNLVQNCISYSLFILQSTIYAAQSDAFITTGLQKDKISFPFKLKGGLGMSWTDTPAIYNFGNFAGLVLFILTISILIRQFNLLPTYRFSLVCLPILYFVFPELVYTVKDFSGFPDAVSHTLLYIIIFWEHYCSNVALAIILILIDKSLSTENRASVNGYLLSATAALSYFAPIVASFLNKIFSSISLVTLFWWLLAVLGALTLSHTKALQG